MKKVFLYIVIGITLLAIPATIFLLNQQKDIRTKAAPATTLTLTPAAITKQVGDGEFKVNVVIDPGSNQIVTAKLAITFDATILQATAITYGPNAPKVINSGVIAGGTASITVGAASNTQPIKTKGAIAVLTLKPIANTGTSPAQVQFGTTTYVAALGEPNRNALVGSTGANITITGGVIPTPTLSATPTATPSATLTPTPTLGGMGGGEATTSAVQILSPLASESVSAQPTISGKAPAGATVTLVIYSTPQTVIVTANSAGVWSYTPPAPLESGPHNVVASIQTAAGTTQTTTSSFIVAAAVGGATESAMPVVGNMDITLLLVTLSVIFVSIGALIPMVL